MKTAIKKFLTAEDGATAVEYAVMLALIIAVLIVGITATGSGTLGYWQNTNDEFSAHGI